MKGKERSARATFGNNYFLICPTCKIELSMYDYLKLKCRKCDTKYLKSRVKATCSQQGCKEVTVALSIGSDGNWESRCQLHLDSNSIPVGIKRKVKYKTSRSKKANVLIDAERGRKERVVKKGEFSGQHLK